MEIREGQIWKLKLNNTFHQVLKRSDDLLFWVMADGNGKKNGSAIWDEEIDIWEYWGEGKGNGSLIKGLDGRIIYQNQFSYSMANLVRVAICANQNLDGADFSFAQFKNLNLQYSFRNSSFKGADLRCSNLSGADLRNADLTDADLLGCILQDAQLEGAILPCGLPFQEGMDLRRYNRGK